MHHTDDMYEIDLMYLYYIVYFNLSIAPCVRPTLANRPLWSQAGMLAQI